MDQSIASGNDRYGTDGAPAGAHARARSEFLRAQRHTKRVRWLKIGMPLIAGAIVLAGLVAIFVARTVPADVTVASTSIEDGRLVMQDPRMSGSDQYERPFSVIAQRAIQSLTGGGIDLEAIQANLSVDDETTANLVADSGRYDPETGRLRLYDDIRAETSDGISVSLSSADILVQEGRLEGTGPVVITTPSQRLEAGAVSVSESGSRLSFTDRVKLTLLPTAESAGERPDNTEE